MMMGDNSMGETPEDLYHHMQVPELCKNEQGTIARGLSFLESDLRAGNSKFLASGFRTHISIASKAAFFLYTTPSLRSHALLCKQEV